MYANLNLISLKYIKSYQTLKLLIVYDAFKTCSAW